MNPSYVRVFLVDPVTDDRFPIRDDIQVDIVRIESPGGPVSEIGGLPLTLDRSTGLFRVDAPEYQVTRHHHFRVRFLKTNFSKSARRLLSFDEVTAAALPVYCPARLPYWDSGWADYYSENRFFGRLGIRGVSSPERPLTLEVPIREVFVIGHRGAPHRFPENTIASFAKALDLGANGLELDLCYTRDANIVVFHDPEPAKYPGNFDRTMFEGLPFQLISPVFDITGREVCLRERVDGQFAALPPRPLASEGEFDIINLTPEEVRKYYHYDLLDGVEHAIPELREFLAFAASETRRLRFVFFDVKNPARIKRREFGTRFGSVLGKLLREQSSLPERLVICNDDPAVLRRIKRGVLASGERRCRFAYDASGGITEFIGIERKYVRRLPAILRRLINAILPNRYDPLDVAQRMHNAVVSVGNIMRPAHMEEISTAVRDRDHNWRSPVEFVVHWTLNDQAQFAESMRAGVNGILTDKPEELGEYLKTLGVRVSCPESQACPGTARYTQ